jgi:hypothetical protein
MKNNFDLKGYMKSNQVGSYQQLNEMWYQDINQALGDFNVIKEEDEMEEAAGDENLKVSLDYADYPSISDAEQKMAINQFMKLVKSLGGNATKTGDKFSTIDFEITGGPSFEELQAAYDKQGEDMFASVLASWKLNKSDLEEMGGVKNIGDKAKLATPNARPNLGRHRSSDMLDKISKKDHDKNTVVGAKAAAYKAPHMKEEETADDIFAGSDKAKWDNYGNETSEWNTEIAGQTVKGWTAEETQGGAIAWQNPKYPNAHIYATPGWEGVDGIAFELHDSEDGYMDEPKIQKVIGSGTEAWKTKAGYMALMAKAFTVVEKMLTPSDNMDEDHGTQVNHDMNDDISMDYTEPEHMVQNEDEDPFGSIKTGIDKITQGDDDMEMGDDDRMMSLGGDRIKAGIESLMADGFDYREILQFVKDTIAAKRNF